LTQQRDTVLAHYQAILDHYGPGRGLRIARKHINRYLERLGVESVGPLGKKPFQDAANVQGDDSHFLSSLRVSPQTTLRYKLTGVGAREFRAVISPIAGSRGDATVILVASGKEFYRQNLSAGDESRILQLPLPQGDDLELRVEFGKHLAYPCGIHLGDAQIAMLDKPREVNHP